MITKFRQKIVPSITKTNLTSIQPSKRFKPKFQPKPNIFKYIIPTRSQTLINTSIITKHDKYQEQKLKKEKITNNIIDFLKKKHTHNLVPTRDVLQPCERGRVTRILVAREGHARWKRKLRATSAKECSTNEAIWQKSRSTIYRPSPIVLRSNAYAATGGIWINATTNEIWVLQFLDLCFLLGLDLDLTLDLDLL